MHDSAPPSAEGRDNRPPYQRIAAALAHRIASGDLPPGALLPSTRAITRDWRVAMATATKALTVLRQQGLVEVVPGVGTRVAPAPAHRVPPSPTPPRPPAAASDVGAALTPGRVVSAAVAVADREGLEALTMRRVAVEVGVAAMSLYRHVSGKQELVRRMVDAVFGTEPLPPPAGLPWRERLELVSRVQWTLYGRHLWLARVISFSRPLLAPNAMAHTEWTLDALHGLGLSAATMAREAITLPAVVRSLALTRATEHEAAAETGVSNDAWWQVRADAIGSLEGSGRFPRLADMAGQEVRSDFDGLFAYGLALHLDGLAVLVSRSADGTA